MLPYLLALLKVALWIATTFFLYGLVDRLTKTPVRKKFNFLLACSTCVAYFAALQQPGGFTWTYYLLHLWLLPAVMLVTLPLVVLFHWALFHTSKPIFQAVMNAFVQRLDIVKKGDLYLRRWYLTPRFNWSDETLMFVESRGWDRLLTLMRSRYFLHWIVRSDDDRDPHDHPWSFKSRILDGEYVERVWFPMDHSEIPLQVAEDSRYMPALGQRYWVRQCVPGMVLDNDWDHTHMVRIVKPVYSLVLAGPKGSGRSTPRTPRRMSGSTRRCICPRATKFGLDPIP
jgi:hypothetical protein